MFYITMLLRMRLLFRWIPGNRGRQEQVVVRMIIFQTWIVLHSAQWKVLSGKVLLCCFLVFMQLLERCGAFGDVHRNEFRCYKIVRAWRHLVLNPQIRKRFKIRLRFIPRRVQIFVALGKRSRSKTLSMLKWWLDRATQGMGATTKPSAIKSTE